MKLFSVKSLVLLRSNSSYDRLPLSCEMAKRQVLFIYGFMALVQPGVRWSMGKIFSPLVEMDPFLAEPHCGAFFLPGPPNRYDAQWDDLFRK